MSSEPVKIAIIMDGGIIQAVLTAGVPVEYVVVDYDTGDTPGVPVPQDDGRIEEGLVHTGTAEAGGEFVLNAFELADLLPVFCVTLRASGIQVTATTEAQASDYAKDDARQFLRDHAYSVDDVERCLDEADDAADVEIVVELEEEGKGRGERLWNFAALLTLNVAAEDREAAPEAMRKLLQIGGELNR